MFKQIFRIAFVSLIWKQYKAIIISTVVLFAYLWLIGSVHSDYLNYAELQEDKSLAGRSFILKWAALSSGVLLYIAYHVLRGSRNRQKSSSSSSSIKGAALSGTLVDQPKGVNNSNYPDPFAEIRTKKKLRTRAEIAIDKQGEKQ